MILYPVPCTLNFGIRLCTVATMSYGNCGFAIGVVMLGWSFRRECDRGVRLHGTFIGWT